MTTASQEVLHTPLYERHVEAGAQMVEFGGWMMPLQYSSMREEHTAVRTDVGVFDVSHMGEFRLDGAGALGALERVVSNRVSDLVAGQARYNVICNEAGGIIDDALVYRYSEDRFIVVVNAGPRLRDLEHFRAVVGETCEVEDLTPAVALIAVQGPGAVDALRPLASIDLDAIGYYHFMDGQLGGINAGFSRTGYTGEDGFELFVGSEEAVAVWDLLVGAGAIPCGLGARDTLRLEAAMRLSGQDIDETSDPLEAGLGWAVKLDKGDFVGRDALLRIRAAGPRRTFVGLEMDGRSIARHGYDILAEGARAGVVTSGTFAFSLGRAVAMGYVASETRDSDGLSVDLRGEPVAARRVPLPFYKRPRG